MYYPDDFISLDREKTKNIFFVAVETLSNEKTRASLVEVDTSKEWSIDDFGKLAATIEECILRLSPASEEKVVEVNPNLMKLSVYGFRLIENESNPTFAKYSGAYGDENFSIKYPAFSDADESYLNLIVELNKHDIVSTKQTVIPVEKDAAWNKQRYEDLSRKVKEFVDAF